MNQKFATRSIKLIGEQQRNTSLSAIQNLPVGVGLEVVIRAEVKVRKLTQSAAYHAGPLRDIADQAWIGDRQYSAAVLHEHFKAEFLPEENDPDLADLVRDHDTYHKWAYTPAGERVLIGSTTQLTIKGFAIFMMQVEAFGANLGVHFSAPPGGREE